MVVYLVLMSTLLKPKGVTPRHGGGDGQQSKAQTLRGRPIILHLLEGPLVETNYDYQHETHGKYDFNPLKLEHKLIFDKYLQNENVNLCDYSFVNTFIWRSTIQLSWTIINDNLCLFGKTHKGIFMMLPPLGRNNIPHTLRECFAIMKELNAEACLRATHRQGGFESSVNYVYAEFLELFDNDEYRIVETYPDYVYHASDLINLAGRKYEKKRNEINSFKKYYNATYEPFEARHIADTLKMIDEWRADREAYHGPQNLNGLVHEVEASKCATIYFEELGLKGAVVLVDGKVEGFTFGEFLTSDMASVLIEKTNRKLHGLAQYIYQKFCATEYRGAKYVTAGEDWGIEGLRIAKTSYRPCMMAKKFTILER